MTYVKQNGTRNCAHHIVFSFLSLAFFLTFCSNSAHGMAPVRQRIVSGHRTYASLVLSSSRILGQS